ncbi:MAG: hypothetical protein JO200_08460 [Comamonas sp.]|nr:hypothetical protein [Comamonas sp.]
MSVIKPIPEDFAGDESLLSGWQAGDVKPELEGSYLRDFDEGAAISIWSGGKWRRDGFFSSDIQDAPWRGIPAEQIAEFTLEPRYFVWKCSDMVAAGLTDQELDQLNAICAKVDAARAAAGKPDLECVVVEKDWPEYEPALKAIQQRVAASSRPSGQDDRHQH